jgi:dihydrofolate reductase
MRTVTYGGAVSLDGFLAGVDGAIDWLHFSKDAQQAMSDYWKDVDTILMGRKTYEVAAARGRADGKKPKKAKPRTGKEAMRSYVFSRTLQAIDDPGVELVASDAVGFVRAQAATGQGNLLDGRRRIGDVAPGCGLGGSNRPEHSPDSARLRNSHVPRSRTSRQIDPHGMPTDRGRLHPRVL